MSGHETFVDRAPTKPGSRASRVQKVRSPGGVGAWLVEDYAIPIVAVNFGFKGGAAQDPEGKPGVATLLSGLLDEGAGHLDSAAFHQALDDDAIELSFSADRDNFQGRLKTLSKNAGRAFELLALSVGAARLDSEAVERVRSQIASSLRRETNDPDHAAARLFRIHSYPDHPYGAPVKGDLDTLAAITRDDLVTLRTRLMARDNLKIAVVGAIDAETLGRELDRVFAGLPAAADLMPIPLVTLGGVGSRHITTIDVPQSTIRFGRQGLMRDDPDYNAATVVNHCLGGGAFTARLYKEVREKRGSLLFRLFAEFRARPCGHARRRDLDEERACRRGDRRHPLRDRPDVVEGNRCGRTREGQEVLGRVLRAALRHVAQDRRPPLEPAT